MKTLMLPHARALNDLNPGGIRHISLKQVNRLTLGILYALLEIAITIAMVCGITTGAYLLIIGLSWYTLGYAHYSELSVFAALSVFLLSFPVINTFLQQRKAICIKYSRMFRAPINTWYRRQ